MISMFWEETPDVGELLLLFGDTRYPVIARPDQLAEIRTPCHWSAPNICSAPSCIEKAYAELREAA
jgi:hypothetical protein